MRLVSHTAVRHVLGKLSETGAPIQPRDPVLAGCNTA